MFTVNFFTLTIVAVNVVFKRSTINWILGSLSFYLVIQLRILRNCLPDRYVDCTVLNAGMVTIHWSLRHRPSTSQTEMLALPAETRRWYIWIPRSWGRDWCDNLVKWFQIIKTGAETRTAVTTSDSREQAVYGKSLCPCFFPQFWLHLVQKWQNFSKTERSGNIPHSRGKDYFIVILQRNNKRLSDHEIGHKAGSETHQHAWNPTC